MLHRNWEGQMAEVSEMRPVIKNSVILSENSAGWLSATVLLSIDAVALEMRSELFDQVLTGSLNRHLNEGA